MTVSLGGNSGFSDTETSAFQEATLVPHTSASVGLSPAMDLLSPSKPCSKASIWVRLILDLLAANTRPSCETSGTPKPRLSRTEDRDGSSGLGRRL